MAVQDNIRKTISSGEISKSYVGMIIYSKTLDTESSVINFYGGEHWRLIENKFLRGASGVYEGENAVDLDEYGGAETVKLTTANLPKHRHTFAQQGTATSATANQFEGIRSATQTAQDNTPSSSYGQSAANLQGHENMPPYITTYIWERVG